MDFPSPGPLPAFPRAPVDVRFAAAASWVRFVDPRTPDAALMPGPVLPRPAGSPAVAAQWREWQEAVLSGQNPPARPQMLVAEGPPTAPAPDFGPLARWPDLRRHCEGGWDAFQRWFRAFGLVGAGVFADLPAGSSAAPLLATAPGQTARLDVVGLAEPAVLREEPGAALVTLGFVASGRYLSWLRAFTASAPVREEPPDWFDPPVPARPARRRPADIGDHRVFPAAGAAAQWYAFADPGIPGRELLGSPAGRPEAGPGVRREWGRWWDGVPLGSGGDAHRALADFAASAPDFAPLAGLPELRRYCREAWPGFRAWLPAARRPARRAARAAAGRIADLHALHPRWRKASTRQDAIDVAAVAAPGVLLEAPGFALVTAGFVETPEFADWALEFTADPD
ncbi:hypothetical protein [Nocardiopsis composta]|uniref:Uncharacterized protein n=1 Tax=Nocardiopsis composta TaxID=157465 RepID=A0A7W8QI08_9ACTN|nr:hypothetical protein [Nocardiopsis composta]MBB5430128.1 hypothetical protein [Nocardiopsis composta]